MPDKLEEGEVQEILDAYEREQSYSGAAEQTGYSKSTVKKYVERNLDDEPEPESDESGTVMDLPGDDRGLVDLTDEELMDMDPADFVETFFSEFDEMGVRDSFVQMISNQARLRQQIPDEDQMAQRIQSHNSGVGNANDANAIAELYWAIAQRYLRARGLSPGGGMAGGAPMGMNASGPGGGGDWVSTPGGLGQQQSRSQSNDGGDGGDWVSAGQPNMGQQSPQAPNQQQPPQQSGEMGQMAMMFRQMMNQQQKMMQEMMQKQEQSEKDTLRREIDELKSELSSDDSGSGGVTESMKEVMELREMLDKFEGRNENGQMEDVVGVLQQQLSSLERQIQDGNQSADLTQALSQGDSQFGLLAALAQSGDVDPTEMVELAQNLGEVETHPEVAEKKYEKEIEKMRVDAEREKWDSILNGAEQLATSIGSAFAGGALEQQANGDGQREAEPEVAARGGGAESSGDDTSPAAQMVQQATEMAAGGGQDEAERVEPEPTDVTPDTNPGEQAELIGEPTIEVEEEIAEEHDLEVADEPTDETRAEADGGTVCPDCGKSFESEQALWGHKSGCPERDDE